MAFATPTSVKKPKMPVPAKATFSGGGKGKNAPREHHTFSKASKAKK